MLLKKFSKNHINKFKEINTNFIMKIFTDYQFENNESDFIYVVNKYMNTNYRNIIGYIKTKLEEKIIFQQKYLVKKTLEMFALIIFIKNIYIITMVLLKNISKFSSNKNIDLILGI